MGGPGSGRRASGRAGPKGGSKMTKAQYKASLEKRNQKSKNPNVLFGSTRADANAARMRVGARMWHASQSKK
jgi:predicted transcriptional regulator